MKILNYKLTILNFTLISLILLLIGNLAVAKVSIVNENTSSVINNVSAESNTGGVVIINGTEQVSGKNNSSASVYTKINGEVVQDINEQTTGGSIEIHSEVQVDNEDAHAKTVIEKNSGPAVAGQVSPDTAQVSTDTEQVINMEIDDNKVQVDNDYQFKKENSILLFWQSIINKIKDLFSIFK